MKAFITAVHGGFVAESRQHTAVETPFRLSLALTELTEMLTPNSLLLSSFTEVLAPHCLLL